MQQRLVGALLHDLAVAEHDDVVRVLDRGKPVGDHQHRADVFDLLQRVLDQKLGLGVDVGRRLVENDHRGLVQDGPCKAQKLALAGREIVAALAHRLVQAFFQPIDKVVCVHIPAGLHDRLVVHALHAQQKIASDVAREQEHVLQHLAEVPAQRGDLDGADIASVDQNAALLDVVVSHDQAQDRGLARAG